MKKKAKVDTPVSELNDKETLEHYAAVVYEDARSTIRMLIEGMENRFEKLERRLHAQQEEIDIIKSILAIKDSK